MAFIADPVPRSGLLHAPFDSVGRTDILLHACHRVQSGDTEAERTKSVQHVSNRSPASPKTAGRYRVPLICATLRLPDLTYGGGHHGVCAPISLHERRFAPGKAVCSAGRHLGDKNVFDTRRRSPVPGVQDDGWLLVSQSPTPSVGRPG